MWAAFDYGARSNASAGRYRRPTRYVYEKDGGALGIWRKWADNLQGQAMKGGHFFPEENPTETAEILAKFLST